MAWIYVAVAAALAAFALDPAQAQVRPLRPLQPSLIDEIYRPLPQRWDEVGTPTEPLVDNFVLEGTAFDLAIGRRGFPVLVFIEEGFKAHLRNWDGQDWTSLKLEMPFGFMPFAVRAAASSSSDVVIAVRALSFFDPERMEVFRFDGSTLVSLPDPGHSRFDSYALAFDGENPVVATQDGNSIRVSRFNGTRWDRLGERLKSGGRSFNDPRSPALLVTADRRIVVAYSWQANDHTSISAASWDGSHWVAFGEDIPFPARSPSLGSGHGFPSIAASLTGRFPEVRRWNGSHWSAPARPCKPPSGQRNFGPPSLVMRTMRISASRFPLADQPMLVCAIGRFNREERTLLARLQMPSGSWEQLGTGSINGPTALAEGSHLAFIMQTDSLGRPWVAWSARDENGLSVRVSHLVPLDGPNP